MSRILDPRFLDSQLPRFLDFQISRLCIPDIYGSRCATGMYEGLEDTQITELAGTYFSQMELKSVLSARQNLVDKIVLKLSRKIRQSLQQPPPYIRYCGYNISCLQPNRKGRRLALGGPPVRVPIYSILLWLFQRFTLNTQIPTYLGSGDLGVLSLVAAVLPPTCLPLKLCATEYSCLDHSPGLVRGKLDTTLGMSDSYRLNSLKQRCCLSTQKGENLA